MAYHWDKVIKGATKSKHSPPKAKYIDPIVDATYEDPQAIYEISAALATRLRDPNSTVLFKALITIHTLLRVGNVSTVYDHLASYRPLPLSSVVPGHDTPHNLTKYALYLERRIKTYGLLKYDMREISPEHTDSSRQYRLRSLSVDKGLLRETGLLQKVLDSLTDCKLYLDDVDDDVTLTGLRLLVKDLLLLFQAVNEAIINILEHYFEMAKTDAQNACKIYRKFCAQTEKVVAYLSVARKLENIIRVPIPNLKHAPVSLAKSLEEYLNDPNFERNRLEYKENKRIADGAGSSPAPKPAKTPEPNRKPALESTPKSTTSPSKSDSKPNATNTTVTPSKTKEVGNMAFTDFFESIEKEQQSIFQPQQQQSVPSFQPFNPFGMQQQPMIVGMPTGQPQHMMGQPTGVFLQAQPTGFNPFMQQQQSQSPPPLPTSSPFGLQPQQTASPFGIQPQQTASPFGLQQQQTAPPFGGLQPQATGFIAPQMTGANPFRQSMLPSTQFPQQQQQQGFSQTQQKQNSLSFSTTSSTSPFGILSSSTNSSATPFSKPQSPPPTSSAFTPSTPTQQKPLVAQPTGSLNPFAPLAGQTPPKPPQPSMNQLAASGAVRPTFAASSSPQPQPTNTTFSAAGTSIGGISAQPTGSIMSSVASSFINPQHNSSTPAPPTSTTNTTAQSSAFSPPIRSNTMPPQATGATPQLTAQPTGPGGSSVQPFKPTSSFGASLAEKYPLPNISSTSSPPPILANTTASFPLSSSLSASSSPAPAPAPAPATSTSSSVPFLTTQMTGFNPFAAGNLSNNNPALSANHTGSPWAAHTSSLSMSVSSASQPPLHTSTLPTSFSSSALQHQHTSALSPWKPSAVTGGIGAQPTAAGISTSNQQSLI